MTKLHELLAAEKRVNEDTQTVLRESIGLFQGNHALFLGREIDYEVLITDDTPPEVVNTIEKNHSESSTPSSTLEERLAYTLEAFRNGLQLSMNKEETNCIAKADLVVDGTVLVPNVPATALLTLETKLNSLLQLFQRIPTRDPMVKWTPVDDTPGIYASEPTVKSVTRKVEKVQVTVPATEQHPAQTRVFTIDEVYAKRTTTVLTSLISSERKMKLMSKLSTLISACRAARARANETPVNKTSISEKVVSFLLSD